MFGLYMRRALSDDDFEDLDVCLATLGPAYRPQLSVTRQLQADNFGVESANLLPARSGSGYATRELLFAELFAVDEGIVTVRLEHGNERRLLVCAMGVPAIKARLEEVAGVLEEHYDVDLAPYRYTSDDFKGLKAEGMRSPEPPSAEERAASEILAEPVVRRTLLAIAASGGMLMSDVPKQLHAPDEEQALRIIEDLSLHGLVDSDLVVICSRDGRQVARVPSREALHQAAAVDMRCACGGSLLDEVFDEVVAVSELGRRLLNGSWWMTVILMTRLESLGIDYESMLVEQKQGGDEMDCFADISGELTLFELKDKEFSLGNAYSFGAKIGIYDPEHAVVVTTSRVGNDAKEHFARAQKTSAYSSSMRSHRIRYVEGIESLGTQLVELVEGIASGDAADLLDELLPQAALDAVSLVEALKAKSSQQALT